MRHITLFLLACLLAACVSAPPPRPPATVVLVSLDGFRPSELGTGRAPNLDAIARDGVRAEYMRPSYPSLTFPNHYTLVTGLRPDHHGVVQNTMRDAVLGRFRIKDTRATDDARWWSAAEPLWVTAERAGLPTATMFWPGSSAAIGGVRPREWRPYDHGFPAETRVDTVLGWLTRPAAERPRFITLYFERLDEASHDHGPDSPEARAAVSAVDGYVGRLRAGIAANGLRDAVDLVVVSDHGMVEVQPGHEIAVDTMVPADVAEPVTTGQSLGFQPLPGREAEARQQLLGRHEHYECWTRETLPARWHYGRNPRVPPIVCQMDEGWNAQTAATVNRRVPGASRGDHGFDPALPSMRALFVAEGPSFRHGLRLPAFDNVDVYPMLAHLIGVTPRDNDGNPATLQPALVRGR